MIRINFAEALHLFPSVFGLSRLERLVQIVPKSLLRRIADICKPLEAFLQKLGGRTTNIDTFGVCSKSPCPDEGKTFCQGADLLLRVCLDEGLHREMPQVLRDGLQPFQSFS